MLRHENQVLRRQLGGRLRWDHGDRLWLAALSRMVSRRRWTDVFPEIVPAVRLDYGLLDVVILAPGPPAGLVNVGYRVLTGSRRDDARLERYQARTIEISAEAELRRQADGEMIAPGRSLAVSVRPGALKVLVAA